MPAMHAKASLSVETVDGLLQNYMPTRWWRSGDERVEMPVVFFLGENVYSFHFVDALGQICVPRVHPGDRRRLDFVVYGATSNGEALCCDATLVSPLTRAGRPVPGADAREGVALVAARRRKVARYPELTRGGPQRLVVLAAEVGGRWSDECQQFLRTLLRLRVQRAPPPLRAAAAQGWARRWWSVLSVALQRAVASSALGVWTMPPLPGAPDALPLGDVLDLAIASAPSRLPFR